jgi:hypothetical protein
MKRISKISVLSELLEEIEEMHEELEESRSSWSSQTDLINEDDFDEMCLYDKMVDKIEDAIDTIQLFRTELETTDLMPDADYKELSRILMDLELKLGGLI